MIRNQEIRVRKHGHIITNRSQVIFYLPCKNSSFPPVNVSEFHSLPKNTNYQSCDFITFKTEN